MIYDITQPLFECCVFPGDPAPERKILMKLADGDACNLTAFFMCAHNGTHVDAPYHFLQAGKAIHEIPLSKWIGNAYVKTHAGNVTAEDAKQILVEAKTYGTGAEQKILLRGKATVTLEAAKVFAGAKIDLFGNESQTVGPEDAPRDVHLALLGAGVVLLEGIRLEAVPDGVYRLHCAPLNLTNADGAPCRATLETIEG